MNVEARPQGLAGPAYGDCAYDWDELADIWDAFEDQGFSAAVVAPQEAQLRAPVAIVGCGTGGVLAYLQARFGADRVWGFDASLPMTQRALARGCANVVHVDPAAPLPAERRFATVLIATGVIDQLSPAAAGAFFAHVRERLEADGEVWVYAFAKWGPHWDVACALGAAGPLGISNRTLFDLYAAAGGSALPRAAAERLRLGGRAAVLQSRIWLAGIDRLVARVAAQRACTRAEAFALVRRIVPDVQRRFEPEELRVWLEQAGLRVMRTERFDRAGVLQLVGRPHRPTEPDVEEGSP